MITTRQCKVCKLDQTLDQFHWYTTSAGNRLQRFTCKSCITEGVKRHRASEAYDSRNVTLRRYSLTKTQFEELSKDGCKVCGSFDKLVIDHDHTCCSGATSCGSCVRGVLCNSCNSAEGFLKGSPDRAMALAAYLLEWESNRVT